MRFFTTAVFAILAQTSFAQTTIEDITRVAEAQSATCNTLDSDAVQNACREAVERTRDAMVAAVEMVSDDATESPDPVDPIADNPLGLANATDAAIWAEFLARREVCNEMDGSARSDCVTSATVARDTALDRQTVSQNDTNTPAPFRSWTSRSPIDDSKTVFVVYESTERKVMRSYGEPHSLEMTLRCLENTTTLYFNHRQAFFADIQGYGRITLRLDEEPAFTRDFNASTDNQALGRWNGGRSIPVIREMFDNDRLTVRLTPFNESPRTFTFNIRGLSEAVSDLRETCNW